MSRTCGRTSISPTRRWRRSAGSCAGDTCAGDTPQRTTCQRHDPECPPERASRAEREGPPERNALLKTRRILGIDPGSRRTGYGIVDIRGNQLSPVAWGVIRTDGADSFPDRLYEIHDKLSGVIRLHRPTEAAVEKVFLAKNAASALKLGQARGAAIVTCRTLGVAVHEYSAKEIKAAATGNGAAPKEQVAAMVRRLLGLRDDISPDASDALAAAFCRAVTRTFAP